MAVATPPGLTPCVILTVDKSAESKAALELIHDMPRGCHVSDIHDLLPAETAAACRQTSSWQEMIDVVGRCDLRGRLGAGLVPANVPSRCLGWVGAESEHPPLIRPRIRASPGKLPLCVLCFGNGMLSGRKHDVPSDPAYIRRPLVAGATSSAGFPQMKLMPHFLTRKSA